MCTDILHATIHTTKRMLSRIVTFHTSLFLHQISLLITLLTMSRSQVVVSIMVLSLLLKLVNESWSFFVSTQIVIPTSYFIGMIFGSCNKVNQASHEQHTLVIHRFDLHRLYWKWHCYLCNMAFLQGYVKSAKFPTLDGLVNNKLQNIIASSLGQEDKSPDLLYAWWIKEFEMKLKKQNKY